MLRKEIGLRIKKYTFKYEYDEAENGRFAWYFWTISWHD